VKIDVLSMFWNAFLQQPFWIQAALVIGVILRLGWPELFADCEIVPRRRRWRRRNRWDA
jgi:hypothetical protein